MLGEISEKIDAHFRKRWISSKKLREILKKLPDDCLLFPNRVGNLAVTKDDEQHTALGFIDIAFEYFEEV